MMTGIDQTPAPPQNQMTVIGIDLGGTKIAGGLVSLPSGKILAKEIIPTPTARGGPAVLGDLVALARRLHALATSLGLSVQGIGIGLAELINLQGEISSEYLVNWRELPAKQVISEIAPTLFESDARAPALAEALFGAGRDFDNFIYLTVGTGIGFCLMLDGQPYAGAHGHAIMVGSGALTSQCERCGAKQDQVLEQFAAGPSLIHRYNQRTGRTLAEGQEVTAAAADGDPIAQEIVRSAGEALGNSVGFLINVLDPQAVIVGGGLGLAGGLYWESFIASTRRHVWSEISRGLPIISAQLGSDAGLIGAAASIWKAGFDLGPS
jgi:glucokinase